MDYYRKYLKYREKHRQLVERLVGGQGSNKKALTAYSKYIVEHVPVEEILSLEPISISDRPSGLVIIDVQECFIAGGSFAVEEGEEIIDGIGRLINRFKAVDQYIYLSRDVHPVDHVSFEPLREHCLFSAEESRIVAPLVDQVKDYTRARVYLKGFHSDIDSFGAFKYEQDVALGRIAGCGESECELEKTGSFRNRTLKPIDHNRSDLDVEGLFVDAPEDAVRMEDDLLDDGVEQVFICGLAGDFCVLDSAINLRRQRPDLDIYVVFNRIRFAFGPGADLASRLMVDPASIVKKYKQHRIKLIWSSCITDFHISPIIREATSKKCRQFFRNASKW
jgi:nicotinamidase-related amidase